MFGLFRTLKQNACPHKMWQVDDEKMDDFLYNGWVDGIKEKEIPCICLKCGKALTCKIVFNDGYPFTSCTVYGVNGFETTITPYIGKVVRDKIVDRVVAETGDHTRFVVLSERLALFGLLAKLQEEMMEFAESLEVEELADIIEVVRAIASLMGVSWEGVEFVRRRKLEENGDFTHRVMMRAERENRA